MLPFRSTRNRHSDLGMLPTRIYLTGFMGSGKSTIGPLVAEVLGYDFVDLDEVIVQQAGQAIPQIFAREGETSFRRRETEALHGTAKRDRLVTALGGGALTFEHNLSFAKDNGMVIYLRVSPEELINRLLQGQVERPLLGTSAVPEEDRIRQRVADLLPRREPFYARAHVTIDASGKDVRETVAAVLDIIRAWEVAE